MAVKFECTFQLTVIPKYSLFGVTGSILGTRTYGSFSDLSADITTAYGKTLPVGNQLQVIVKFKTDTGPHEAILIPGNYEDGLTAIQSILEGNEFTLKDLLGE
jgi:hypothetical protein